MRTPLTHEVLASRAGTDEQQLRHRLEVERAARLNAEAELENCRDELAQARAELKTAQQGAEAALRNSELQYRRTSRPPAREFGPLTPTTSPPS